MSKDYRFLGVTDPHRNLAARQTTHAFDTGARIFVERDPQRGFLGARLDYVRKLCDPDDRYVCPNHDTNPMRGKRTTAAPPW